MHLLRSIINKLVEGNIMLKSKLSFLKQDILDLEVMEQDDLYNK